MTFSNKKKHNFAAKKLLTGFFLSTEVPHNVKEQSEAGKTVPAEPEYPLVIYFIENWVQVIVQAM